MRLTLVVPNRSCSRDGGMSQSFWNCSVVPHVSFPITLRHGVLTPCRRVLLEKLTVSQPAKKLPTFYETRMFITVLTVSRQIVPILSQMNPIQANLFDFLENHFNILSSTPRYSKRSPSFRFSHKMKYQNGVCERFGGPKRGKCNNFNILLRS